MKTRVIQDEPDDEQPTRAGTDVPDEPRQPSRSDPPAPPEPAADPAD